MVIQIDTRQKAKKKHHIDKEKWLLDHGHTIIKSKCLVGDYVCPSNGSISVDTKQNCSELYTDLIQDHQRFHNEVILAQDCNIKLYILVENTEGMKNPQDILKWKNPQMFRYYKAKKKAEKEGTRVPKPPASNVQLLKIMHSMTRDYGVEFVFCSTKDAGKMIVKLLEGEKDG